MVDIREPDIKELAKKDYIDGMKYKDIATKYEVSLNTVKSWKQRYKWNRNSMRTNKKVCTQKENKEKSIQEPMHKEVKEVLQNTELTDKQRLFCIYYIKYFNATKAYQKAYNSSYVVANAEGYKLLVNPCIKAEIYKLKKVKLNRAMLDPEDIFQKFMDIAFADITDYVTFGQKEAPEINENGEQKVDSEGNPITYKYNYVSFKESSEVDGTLITEVSQGKNGVSVKLQDRMKALQWLSDRMDLLSTEVKMRLENEKVKVQMAKEKLELEKSKVMGNDEEIQDDGFIEALEGKVEEVWKDEK